MNMGWFYLMISTIVQGAMALDARLDAQNLSPFLRPNVTNTTVGCPSSRPESCDCERFRGKDSGK